MSSSRLPYDSCSYTEKLRASTGPGMYQLGTPENDISGCAQDISGDPHYRFQKWGPNTCPPGSSIDDGSELLGINYKNSRCSADAYLPSKYPQKRGICNVPGEVRDVRKCATPVESTRLSNPPCNLRDTGINRWEWLCFDPQANALPRFDYFTPYRIVAKDNHRPCIEKPIDQTNALPHSGPEKPWRQEAYTGFGAEAPGNPYAPALQTCAK